MPDRTRGDLLDAVGEGSGLTVGIDVGGTKTLGVVLDADDTVVAENRVATPEGSTILVETLTEVIAELVDLAGDVDGVGVGIPGQLDLEGNLRFAPNLTDANEVPIRRLVSEAVGRPIVIDNDANCAIVAEHRMGAIQGVDDAVMVTLGTGIGSSVLTEGTLYRGAHGMAGEWGHITVLPDGAPCACGRRGCWEAYASGAGLVYLAKELISVGDGAGMVAVAGGDPDNVKGEHVTKAARDGDAEALAVLDRFAWWLAIGISNIAAAIDPAAVVLGGGVVVEADLFIEPLQRHYDRKVLGTGHRPRMQIVPAVLGERAGALGAAVIARGQAG